MISKNYIKKSKNIFQLLSMIFLYLICTMQYIKILMWGIYLLIKCLEIFILFGGDHSINLIG